MVSKLLSIWVRLPFSHVIDAQLPGPIKRGHRVIQVKQGREVMLIYYFVLRAGERADPRDSGFYSPATLRRVLDGPRANMLHRKHG